MTNPILGELLERTTALRALAGELVGDARADDIVQEAAIQSLTAPPARPGPAGGWLAAVVRNLASKHRRAERIRHRHEAAAARADIAPADRSAEDADTLRRLTEIVTSLPEPYRGTILARYLREQTPSEIAAATGTPVRTVKTRLQRGLALLRQRLEERGADWRASLATAFQLGPAATPKTVTPNTPTPIGTPMKLALTAAVLLPVGALVWNQLSDAVRTPTQESTAAASNAGRVPGRIGGAPRARDASRATVPALPDDPDLPVLVDPTPPTAVPRPADRPLVHLRVVGPAAFRSAFRATNLGDLLASAPGEELWRPLVAPAERLWRQWDGGADFAATRERLLEYTGSIRVLWIVEPGKDGGRDRGFGVFAMEPDGSTNLTALAGDLSRAMLNIVADKPEQQRVGEHDLRLIGDAQHGFLSFPMVIGDSLVAFFGESGSLEETVARGLRALAMDVEQPSAPVSLYIDLAQLKGLAEMQANPPLVKAFGLQSLRSLHATVRPNGVHAELAVDVAFDEGHRGIVAAFLPEVGTLPSLLARVPPDATPWLTVPFRPGVIYRVAVTATEDYDKLTEDWTPDLRKTTHDQLGLHLDTDLLDHLGGEVMVLGDLWQAGDPQVFRDGDDPPLGACVAFSLKDTPAFAAGFDKLLDHLKGAVNRHEIREVQGVKITRLGTMLVTGMHMAMGQNLCAMAFGREGVAQLEALVAGGRAAAEASNRSAALPAAIQRVAHLAPPGWNGVGLANLNALAGGQVTLALEGLDDALPRQMGFEFSSEATQSWFDELLPLVTRHDLENLVTMTGHDGAHWRLRVLW